MSKLKVFIIITTHNRESLLPPFLEEQIPQEEQVATFQDKVEGLQTKLAELKRMNLELTQCVHQLQECTNVPNDHDAHHSEQMGITKDNAHVNNKTYLSQQRNSWSPQRNEPKEKVHFDLDTKNQKLSIVQIKKERRASIKLHIRIQTNTKQ